MKKPLSKYVGEEWLDRNAHILWDSYCRASAKAGAVVPQRDQSAVGWRGWDEYTEGHTAFQYWLDEERRKMDRRGNGVNEDNREMLTGHNGKIVQLPCRACRKEWQ